MASNSSSNSFISLQDLCKLKVMFSIEEFSIESLALLPQAIKLHLFKVLPIMDRLHFDTSSEFRQEFGVVDVSPPSDEERKSRAIPRTARVLYGNSNDMRETLLRCLFTNPRYSYPYQMTERAFKEGCQLNLKETAKFLDCLSVCDDSAHVDSVFQYIERCCPCTVITIPPHRRPYIEKDQVEDPLDKFVVVPAHITRFMSVDMVYELVIAVTNTRAFIDYCHIQPTLHLPSDKSFSIDTIQLLASPLWKEYYEAHRENLSRPQQLPDGTLKNEVIDPFTPLLRDVLASVEHLSIGTKEEFEPTSDDEELSIDVPYFIFHNLVSHPQPSLKSVHVHGISPTVTNTVQTVAAFLAGGEDSPIAGIMCDRYSNAGYIYSLAVPSKPYFIEELKITAESGDRDYVNQYMTEYDSSAISTAVNQIFEVQKSTLKSISLKDLGFTYKSIDTSNERLESSSISRSELEKGNSNAYCSLLQSVFPEFVKLPQFESLSLGKSPDRKCYHIVMNFLTTPTSHDQELKIMLKPKKTAILDWYKRYKVPQELPESNVQFKSLHLDGKKSQLLKFVLSFPNLSLKSFKLSTHHLTENALLPTTVNIKHFTLHVETDTIDDSKLDIFINKNPLLTTLTVSQDWSHQEYPSVINSVNKCLLRLAEKGGKLESVTLEKINLLNFLEYNQHRQRRQRRHHHGGQAMGLFAGDDESGYDFTNPGPATSTNAPPVPAVISIPPSVTDKDLYSFFLLVEKLGATLTIISDISLYEADRLNVNLIPSLEQANVRIRKLTLKGSIKKYKQFNRIAAIEIGQDSDDSDDF